MEPQRSNGSSFTYSMGESSFRPKFIIMFPSKMPWFYPCITASLITVKMVTICEPGCPMHILSKTTSLSGS